MLLEKSFQITVFELSNDGLTALGDLTQYTSIKWPSSFIGCGSFELWAPINEENSMYFKNGNILWSQSEIAAIIECVKSEIDDNGTKSFNVKGRTIERFLMDRIVWGTITYKNLKASTLMYNIIDTQCINPTNSDRIIPFADS